MATLRQVRYNQLRKWGYIREESLELSRRYTMNQLRSTPYIRDMSRWHRLYTANLRSRGLTETEIRTRVRNIYRQRHWLNPDGTINPWDMLRAFRKQSIDEGEYIPKPRKKVPGSHHPLSRRDLDKQKQRRNRRISDLERYARGRGRE